MIGILFCWIDLFEFGSTFATALAVSEAYPTTELAACGGRVIDPKHQIVYLADVTRCRCCSEMRLSDAEPVWWIQTEARRFWRLGLGLQLIGNKPVKILDIITQSTSDMLRRLANLLSLLNWWLHNYDNEDDYALFQV